MEKKYLAGSGRSVGQLSQYASVSRHLICRNSRDSAAWAASSSRFHLLLLGIASSPCVGGKLFCAHNTAPNGYCLLASAWWMVSGSAYSNSLPVERPLPRDETLLFVFWSFSARICRVWSPSVVAERPKIISDGLSASARFNSSRRRTCFSGSSLASGIMPPSTK